MQEVVLLEVPGRALGSWSGVHSTFVVPDGIIFFFIMIMMIAVILLLLLLLLHHSKLIVPVIAIINLFGLLWTKNRCIVPVVNWWRTVERRQRR